ncbi:MAG: UMP kinase [Bacteroidales bacterium]|nr:UMP kinase [Bacteroidales bacterium]
MKLKRILLKLSGEYLGDENGVGISYEKLEMYSNEILKAYELSTQIAIVIGGGNIFRGLKGSKSGFDRVIGDQIGMLATVINSLALKWSLERKNIKVKVYSAFVVNSYTELYNSQKVIKDLEQGFVCLLSGGTGNPYFTTDTAGALRAIEIKADALLKGTKVDGIYDSDPLKNPKAKLYKTISYKLAIQKNLEVMDITAFTLCQENNMPIIVFNINKKENLVNIIKGNICGTVVKGTVNDGF